MGRLRFGKEKKRVNFDLLRSIIVWTFQIIIVCLIAFVLVWYFGQRVSTIGDSMNPELENGDITLLNRIVYNVSSPKRGDIVAFKPNGNKNSHFYIKRIIGLPGETIEIKNGRIYVDGELLKEDYKATSIEDPGVADEALTLGGDEFFVLGDDRQNSEDSRMADVGNVKRSEIEGEVWFVIAPKKHFGLVR